MLLRLSKIEALCGSSRNVANHLARLIMSSDFQPVVSGQARRFSYQNTIELALINAFITAGLPASKAAAFAKPFVAAARFPGIGAPDREWIVFPAGDATQAVNTDAPDLAKLSATFGALYPPVFALVNVGEIFRRVDELFTEAEG